MTLDECYHTGKKIKLPFGTLNGWNYNWYWQKIDDNSFKGDNFATFFNLKEIIAGSDFQSTYYRITDDWEWHNAD